VDRTSLIAVEALLTTFVALGIWIVFGPVWAILLWVLVMAIIIVFWHGAVGSATITTRSEATSPKLAVFAVESLATSGAAAILGLTLGVLWGVVFWAPVSILLVVYWHGRVAQNLPPEGSKGYARAVDQTKRLQRLHLVVAVAGVLLMAYVTLMVPPLFDLSASPNCTSGVSCPALSESFSVFLGIALPIPTGLSSLGTIRPFSRTVPFASATLTVLFGVWQYSTTIGHAVSSSGMILSPTLNVIELNAAFGLTLMVAAAITVALGGVIDMVSSRRAASLAAKD